VLAFSDAYAGVAYVGYYFQGLEEALKACIRINQAIRVFRIEDGEGGLAPGLAERLLIEARQKMGGVESTLPAQSVPTLTLLPFTPGFVSSSTIPLGERDARILGELVCTGGPARATPPGAPMGA
jgi:hypothetical protein